MELNVWLITSFLALLSVRLPIFSLSNLLDIRLDDYSQSNIYSHIISKKQAKQNYREETAHF